MVAAVRVTDARNAPPLPGDLRQEFEEALQSTLSLVTMALSELGWEPKESLDLFGTVAALHGHVNLALLVFSACGQSDLSCPVCGEWIKYGATGG